MFKEKFIIVASALFAGTAAQAAERSYELEEFTGVNVARGVKLSLTMGSPSISAQTDASDFSDLYVVVDDGVLEVRRKSAWASEEQNRLKYHVTVTAPSLDFLKASTGATLEATDLQLNDVTVSLNTGAVINADGTCNTMTIKAHTGAEFEGRDLLCRSVFAKSRTGGIIDAYAAERANGRARLGGEITFYGNPKHRERGSFLGGEVRYKK